MGLSTKITPPNVDDFLSEGKEGGSHSCIFLACSSCLRS